MSIYRDPKKIAEYLEQWIKDRFAEAGASRAVLGISGGIDSALLAALLAKALGPDNVTGVIMPCHSMPIDEEYARLLAKALKIKAVKVELSPVYDAMSAALAEAGAKPEGLADANIKPRLRMTTLYSIAQQQGALVCGGGNKVEVTVGYFTKYGDSGVDILPLADLLKGEVWAAAEYLGVPREIIDRPPTAGLWEGQTDEEELGVTYRELDEYIATGEGSERVRAKVESAKAKSGHKRAFAPMAKLPDNL